MSALTGFKRLGLAVLTLVALMFGALAMVSFRLPADQVRQTIKAELQAITGLEPHIAGETEISLFPSGQVSFADFALGEGETPPLVADKLNARLRFFPLLTGRVEISDLVLVNPKISLLLNADGSSNWTPLLTALQNNFIPDGGRPAKTISFSEILIKDGTLLVRDESRDMSETVRDIDVSLAWPAISRGFAATGRLTWRHEPLEANIALSDFTGALKGKQTGLKIRLSGAPLRAAFDGNLNLDPTPKIDGVIAADSTSLRRLMLWSGLTPLPGGGFEKFSLKGQANVMGGTVVLSPVNIEIDGNAAEGMLTFTSNERKLLQGTLAADAIDLTPYLSTIQLFASNEREWSRAPLVLDGLSANDIDLRLSATKVIIGPVQVKRAAIATTLRDGKLTAMIGESQAFGGTIKGTIGLAAAENGADFKSQMQFTNVNLEQCIGELFGIRRLEGTGDMTLALDGAGRNVHALTRNLNGQATLSVGKGALAGLNIEQLLRRLESRPLSGGREFRTGRTAFDTLELTLRVAQGTAHIDRMALSAPSLNLSVDGEASIHARDLNLTGTASLIGSSEGKRREIFELPFEVHGSWDNPMMLPDSQILIQRSGAAAPLLEALRERKVQEAVESAIEELGGKGIAPPLLATSPDKAQAIPLKQ